MAERTPEKVLAPQEVGELISALVDDEKPKLDNLIGPFADVIPQLLTVPEQLYETSKQVYRLNELL